MRKPLFLLFFVLLHSYFCIAQDEDSGKDIEAVRTAYITNQLKLSPEEAQKFWPIYNNYLQELKKARKDNPDDVDKLVVIRQKYKSDIKRVIGSDERVNRAFTAEVDFRNMVRKEWQARHPNANGNRQQQIQQFKQKRKN